MSPSEVAAAVAGMVVFMGGILVGAGAVRSWIVRFPDETPDPFSDYGRGWHRGRLEVVESVFNRPWWRWLLP